MWAIQHMQPLSFMTRNQKCEYTSDVMVMIMTNHQLQTAVFCDDKNTKTVKDNCVDISINEPQYHIY